MYYLNLIAGLSALATLSGALCAQTLNETNVLFPSDPAASDNFGTSMAVDGTTGVIGALLSDDNGIDSGSAYLFDITTGLQIAKLLPSDGSFSDFFGVSVAISGATVIVGATRDDDNGSESGSAYLFDAATGQQLFKLLPNDGETNDQFGASVAISGTTAIVGALFDDDSGSDSGSAYLFDTSTGQQIAKLLPGDGAPRDLFGAWVAIRGTTAIIGASKDDDNGVSSGSAYVFDTITGQQIAKLLPNDGDPLDSFGNSIAIGGTTAIIGASLDGDNGLASGSAYLFDTRTWLQIAKLIPSDGVANDTFGSSVAISGTMAVVGAVLDSDNGDYSGSAYLFDTTTGLQIAKLLPSDGASRDYFATSLAIDGTTIMIGADGNDANGADSGSVYVIELDTSTVLNNGAGFNPIVLDDSGVGPLLGQTWPAMVDTATSGHGISSCVFYAGALPPGTLIIGAGEVIVNPFSVNFLSNTVVGTGLNDHSVLVPNDLTLFGSSYTVQAILFSGGPALLLGNALDIRVGF